MATYTVTGDVEAVLRDMRRLPDGLVAAATFAAQNTTAKRIRTEWVRQEKPKIGVTAKVLRDSAKITRARKSRPKAEITIKRGSVRAYELRHSRTAHGVRYAGKIHSGAFIQTMPKSGRIGIYRRTGRFGIARSGLRAGQLRETIKEQRVYFGDVDATLRQVGDRVAREFSRHFDRELSWRLRKYPTANT